MGVRGPGPHQRRVLEVRCCTLALPIPSRRLLRHALLPLALRLGDHGGLTPPRPGALYVPPLTSRAQTTRAILLARATVTSIRGLRASIRASHEPAAAPR